MHLLPKGHALFPIRLISRQTTLLQAEASDLLGPQLAAFLMLPASRSQTRPIQPLTGMDTQRLCKMRNN